MYVNCATLPGRHSGARPSELSASTQSLWGELAQVSRTLYPLRSLDQAEHAIVRVGELLELPRAWWTPDAAHPYNCPLSEEFSRAQGWPQDLMKLWRDRRISLHSPPHIRARFEGLPFVTSPDVRGGQPTAPGYARVNQRIIDMGITTMLHVPVHLTKGRIGLINWAGGGSPRATRNLLPSISGELLVIGHLFMRNYAAQLGEDESVDEEKSRLTVREWDCLRLLAQGYREAEAAELLHIAKSTLRFHVENVVRKFGCKNRTHAIALAAQLGLLGPLGH